MASTNFSLRLTGGDAERHFFEGYDGYNSLAGFAWTLSLVANYVETGKIRQRGDFIGRHVVKGTLPKEGSVVADFLVLLSQHPKEVFGAVGAGSGSALMYALVKRVINQNLGDSSDDVSSVLAELGERREGDIDTLVAISEPAIRQTHAVIGNGASKIEIIGGTNLINTFDHSTEEYVKAEIKDDEIICKQVNVSSFNVNSGYGSVFDFDQGRNIPIAMTRDVLRETAEVFSFGLDAYARRANHQVKVCFKRVLAYDGKPKRYQIISAEKEG